MVSLLIQWFLVWKPPCWWYTIWWIYNVVQWWGSCCQSWGGRNSWGGAPAGPSGWSPQHASLSPGPGPRGGCLCFGAELAALSAQLKVSFPDTVTVIIALFSNSHQVTFVKYLRWHHEILCCLLPDVWNQFICLPSHRAELFLGLMQLPGGYVGNRNSITAGAFLWKLIW